jgi:hypothetical protein
MIRATKRRSAPGGGKERLSGRAAVHASKFSMKLWEIRKGCQATYLCTEFDMSSAMRRSHHAYAARTRGDAVMDIYHRKVGSFRSIPITLTTKRNVIFSNISVSRRAQSYQDITMNLSGTMWYHKQVNRRAVSNISSLLSVHFTRKLSPFTQFQIHHI